MIRRSPTLIPISDADIQDLKEWMSRNQEATERDAVAEKSQKATPVTTTGGVVADDPVKIRESREERLGIR